ncbi:uncharacterized protein LOC129892319 isoform X2 [Solanum dulcamara]|uniref:uncharacterized protein LOC129892319 isoform X2 n=1 Tax=Solanum dulcamara TaxID=45834 RepID=UPI002485FEA5|nr:uncharacterized protein LOC129892319 isoform X2 [Solanum dulcamara]
MTRTRSMATLKPSPDKSIFLEIDFIALSSNSFKVASSVKASTSKKRPPSVKRKETKNVKPHPKVSFGLEDMHKFWGEERKCKFEAFKKRPVVLGRVVNLVQLEESHFPGEKTLDNLQE